MSTDTRAVVGIGSAPQDESQGVRLVRPLGPGQGRPLAPRAPSEGTLVGRVQAVLLATVAVFSKTRRRSPRSEAVLELSDADLVAPSAPPPLPAVKGLQTKLAQPDVHAFFTRK
jgi:hypothetical protein